EVRARMAAQDAASSHYGDTAGPAKAADTDADEDGEEHHDGGNGNGNGTRGQGRPGAAPRPATSALTDSPPVLPTMRKGLDLGPACQQCGGMMQRTGSCYTCSSCGFNTGCG